MVEPLKNRAAMPGQTATVHSCMNSGVEAESVKLVLRPLEMVSVAVDQPGEHAAPLLIMEMSSSTRWTNYSHGHRAELLEKIFWRHVDSEFSL